jgi:hypothetical protein
MDEFVIFSTKACLRQRECVAKEIIRIAYFCGHLVMEEVLGRVNQ